MTHAQQQQRGSSLDAVRRLIALSMPDGVSDVKLQGVLGCSPFGFSPRKRQEYLKDLLDAGLVEWDGERGVWRLPT